MGVVDPSGRGYDYRGSFQYLRDGSSLTLEGVLFGEGRISAYFDRSVIEPGGETEGRTEMSQNPRQSKSIRAQLLTAMQVPIRTPDGATTHDEVSLFLLCTVCTDHIETDRKSTRLNSSHSAKSRMPSSA